MFKPSGLPYQRVLGLISMPPNSVLGCIAHAMLAWGSGCRIHLGYALVLGLLVCMLTWVFVHHFRHLLSLFWGGLRFAPSHCIIHVASLSQICIHALHCLVWGVKRNLRAEECLHFKWQNTSQPSVAKPLDTTMIGCWHSSPLCYIHFYIKLQTWLIRPSCLIDGPRVEDHAPLSP